MREKCCPVKCVVRGPGRRKRIPVAKIASRAAISSFVNLVAKTGIIGCKV
jgi:hypothetical protein